MSTEKLEYDKELQEQDIELEMALDEIEGEKVESNEDGQLVYKSVYHKDRAAKFGVLSDGETSKYVNIALEYFDHRCALSGEKFEYIDAEEIDRKLTSNLSAEHVVPLCQGGHDIVPNLVPSVLQYNISKNGYYLLDWWKHQKDTEGKQIYSPYRLLKLTNFMIKSLQAREYSQGKTTAKKVEKYKEIILTDNEIDKFLKEIEAQDEIENSEKDNRERKIYSSVITATTLDENNKKVLTKIPEIEANIPSRSEQIRNQEQVDARVMMDIFLMDAVKVLEQQLPNETELHSKLNEKLASVVGEIPFEVKVRNIILERLNEIEITDNRYSIANDWLTNTTILQEVKKLENLDQTKKYINTYIEQNILSKLNNILDEQQLKIAISNRPKLLYDEIERNRLKFWKENRNYKFEEILQKNDSTDTIIDVLIILKKNGIDITKIKSTIYETIKDNENKSQILKDLESIIIEGNVEGWDIVHKLSKQKSTNINKIKKEIECIVEEGIYFTDEEIKRITEKMKSEDATKEIIDVIKILNKNKISIEKIKKRGLIKDLLEEKTEKERIKIVKELSEVLGESAEEWPIGERLGTQKSKNNIEKFKEELEKAMEEGLILEASEINKMMGRQQSEDATKESIEVIKVLKKYKTNISDMKYMWNIEDLIEDKTEKERIEIINELKKILGENAAKWPIGERLSKQKAKCNIKKFQKEIDVAMKEGLELTNEEINKLTKKQTKSKNPIKDMIEVVKVLKHNDINISNIKVNGIIKDLFVGKTQEELIKIISELENVIGENVEEWPIGRQISNLKRKDSIEIFKEELEKVKKEENINFMLPEMKVLTTIQNKARDLLEVLKVLKKYEVHIDEIQTRGRTINELIEKNKDKEKILEELGKIITDQEDIGEWDVGTHLGTQKRKNNIKSFQEELEVAMNEGLELTDEEIHNLLDLNRGKDTSRSDEVIKFMKQIVFEQKQNRITWRKL